MTLQRQGDLYALVCAFVCGLGNVPAKVALNATSIELFTFFYFLIAFIISGTLLFKRSTRREILSVNINILALIFVLAILFAGALYFSMSALQLIEPATVSFLSRFEVIVTVVLAYIFLRERLTPIELLGGMITLGGLFVLKYKTNLVISHAATLMVLSSFCFAAAEIIIKKNIKRLPTYQFLFFRNFFMVIVILALIAIKGKTILIPDQDTMLMILAASILMPVIGRATFMETLKRIDISRATLFMQSIPLFTAVFTYIFLTTIPQPIEWFGGALILAGVIVVKLSGKNALGKFKKLRVLSRSGAVRS